MHFDIYESKSQLRTHWKYLSMEFALAYNADVIKLFDNDFFLQNRCYSDEECQKALLEAIKEAESYERAVLLFDLDQISGIRMEATSVTAELQQATMQAFEQDDLKEKFSYEFKRPQTYQQLLGKFETINAAQIHCAKLKGDGSNGK